MNLADQIEAIARAATTRVVDASKEFSATQRRLTTELAEHRSSTDESDVTMVPADVAEAGPHQPAPGE
ncbi:hypothetical protein ACWDTI_07925 [Gordonia sp. NPDC003424]